MTRAAGRVRFPFSPTLRLAAGLAGLAVAAFSAAADPHYTVRMQPLPGATGAGIGMDYIAFDPATGSVWVPAGNTGLVFVIDAASGAIRQIPGFPTAEMGTGDRQRVVGPSSVAIGGGHAYVGNRGDSSVCAFDARSLAKGACHRLDGMPDGLAWVADRGEVWATTPRDNSIRVLDGRTLAEKAKITLDGSPEGFAVDGRRGRFYTNLEDKDVTLAIDLATHRTVATWKPECGEDGPRGLRVDEASGQLLVACTAGVKVLDAAHDGKIISSVDTGEGVDDIDYAPSSHYVYAGAAGSGSLTVAELGAGGGLRKVAVVPTHAGARNAAVTDRGVVYLAHGGSGGLTDMVVATPQP